MKKANRSYILIIVALLFSGCAAPVYKEIFRETHSYNSKQFLTGVEQLYNVTLVAIMSKNFMIEKEGRENNFILAKRPFQQGKRNIVLLLQAKLNAEGENKATLFLNALETTERAYVADRTRFFLWIIPLPGGGGKESSSVKEKEEIITDKEFYQNFFTAINDELQRQSIREPEKEPQVELSVQGTQEIKTQAETLQKQEAPQDLPVEN